MQTNESMQTNETNVGRARAHAQVEDSAFRPNQIGRVLSGPMGHGVCFGRSFMGYVNYVLHEFIFFVRCWGRLERLCERLDAYPPLSSKTRGVCIRFFLYLRLSPAGCGRYGDLVGGVELITGYMYYSSFTNV